MQTKILTANEVKELFVESLLNKTDKITKISDNSILNGVGYGVGKVFQRGMKDSALIESDLFPEWAYAQDLDLISKRYGLTGRLGAMNSSTFVRVVGEYGTMYNKETNIFVTSQGYQFKASQDWTIGYSGYEYVLVRSLLQGESQNVQPNSITKLLSAPAGHYYVNNDIMARGGRDAETDDVFRTRVTEGFNLVATDTLSRLLQILIQLNNNILNVRRLRKTSKGITQLGLITQDGSDLTTDELSYLQEEAVKYLSLSDLSTFDSTVVNIEFVNIGKVYIDIDFRVELKQDTDFDDFVLNCQTQLSKYLDWRFWAEGQKVEWDDLFGIIKARPEIKYIADQYFIPRSDIPVSMSYVPRLRGFIVRSLDGSVIVDNNNRINPVYYQNDIQQNFVLSIISKI